MEIKSSVKNLKLISYNSLHFNVSESKKLIIRKLNKCNSFIIKINIKIFIKFSKITRKTNIYQKKKKKKKKMKNSCFLKENATIP